MAKYFEYDFVRSNGLISSSPSSWVVPTHGSPVSGTIDTNLYRNTNNASFDNRAYYPTALDTTNQYAEITISTAAQASTEFIGVSLRISASNGNIYQAGYGCISAGSPFILLQRYLNGSGAGNYTKTQTLVNGDRLGLSVVASGGNAILTVYINGTPVTSWDTTPSGAWTGGSVSSGVVTDNDTTLSAIPVGLFAGIQGYVGTTPITRVSYWIAGDIPADPGSLSGSTDINFPITVDSGGKFVKDASSTPVSLKMRMLWAFHVMSAATQRILIQDTINRKFNAINWQILVNESEIQTGMAVNPPFDYAGNLPFNNKLNATSYTGSFAYGGNINTLAPDFNTPNSTYWTARASEVALLETNNIIAVIFPLFFTYDGSGWLEEMIANGPTKCGQFGTYLATLFASYGNIIMIPGGDYTIDEGDYPGGTAALQAFIDAWQAVTKASNLLSFHWSSYPNSSYATEVSGFAAEANLNFIYTRNDGLAATTARAAWATDDGPVSQIEIVYERSRLNPTVNNTIRAEALRGWVNGPGGHNHGYEPLMACQAASFMYTDTPLSRFAAAFNTFIDGLAWWKLVPSGLSSMITLVTTNRGTIDTSNANEAAQAADGTLLVLYSAPSAGNPTLNLSTMQSSTPVYQWLDPVTFAVSSSGAFTAASGQAFTRPGGNNSAGTTDWILKLTASSAATGMMKKMRRYL